MTRRNLIQDNVLTYRGFVNFDDDLASKKILGNYYLFELFACNWLYHSFPHELYKGYPASLIRNLNLVQRQYLIVCPQGEVYFFKNDPLFDTTTFHRCQQGHFEAYRYVTETSGREMHFERQDALSTQEINSLIHSTRNKGNKQLPPPLTQADQGYYLPPVFQKLLTTPLYSSEPVSLPSAAIYADYDGYLCNFLFYFPSSSPSFPSGEETTHTARLQWVSPWKLYKRITNTQQKEDVEEAVVYLLFPRHCNDDNDDGDNCCWVDKTAEQSQYPRYLYRYLPSIHSACCGSGAEFYLSMKQRQDWMDCQTEETLKEHVNNEYNDNIIMCQEMKKYSNQQWKRKKKKELQIK